MILCQTRKFSILSIAAETVENDIVNRALYERLIDLFQKCQISYEELVHEATLTSEASVVARINGGWRETTLASGAKAMLMRRKKVNENESAFILCVLAANRKLDWKKLRKTIAKDLRLATEEEVFEVSRCLPGAVPPFGSQFFSEPPPITVMDDSLRDLELINFNCGLRTNSIRMSLATYLDLEQPKVVSFSS
uniref:YbaK/aminoacyl-tRNA synthetase-associated domain-containing protein n=1 Tax=Aureoumbra lagunensis TaxID=44058 RepID=A0A7S3NPU7_9STRA|mmetsp:Transcript_7753/g.11742  ORF Transcript_7753/g.11742 Transcript_7753/m.11742 type:complete len:194 (+) Transcript_7753:66-647(+)